MKPTPPLVKGNISVSPSEFPIWTVIASAKAHVFVYPTRIGHVINTVRRQLGLYDRVKITATSVEALAVEQLS